MNKNSFHCFIKMKIKSIKLLSPSECFGESLQVISHDSAWKNRNHLLERALSRPAYQPCSHQISPASCLPFRRELVQDALVYLHTLKKAVKRVPSVAERGVGKSLRQLYFLSVETYLHAWACLKDWQPKICRQSCPQTQKMVLGPKFCALVLEEKHLTRIQEAPSLGSFWLMLWVPRTVKLSVSVPQPAYKFLELKSAILPGQA